MSPTAGMSGSAPASAAQRHGSSSRTSRRCFPGNVVGVLHRLFGIVLIGHNERGLHNPVLHHLGQRVIAHCPGEVHDVLILGVAEKSSQSASPLGSAR